MTVVVMASADTGRNNCLNAGRCVCNCCDKRQGRHCYGHGTGCHLNCVRR